MKIKRTKGERIFEVINLTLLSMLVLITLYPFLFVLFASISDPAKMASHTGLLLWPIGYHFSAYKYVLSNPNILLGYKNTMIYLVCGVLINIVMTTMAAYVLSRKGYLLKRFFSLMVVFTMFFSGGLIPSYLLVKNLHMTDTRWALLLPGAISTWNLIVMRTSFAGIPESLEESARIDGANDFMILFRIIVPLSLPIIAIMILFYGVGIWNSWFSAMIYLRDRKLYPLQMFLREILVLSDTSDMTTNMQFDAEQMGETIKYATIIVTTVPIICVYPFLQKYFVKGMMVGAIKE